MNAKKAAELPLAGSCGFLLCYGNNNSLLCRRKENFLDVSNFLRRAVLIFCVQD